MYQQPIPGDDIPMTGEARFEFVDALAKAFPSDAAADALLDRIGYGRERRPLFVGTTPEIAWHEILADLSKGPVDAPFRRLLAAALRSYQYNKAFRALARRYNLMGPTDPEEVAAEAAGATDATTRRDGASPTAVPAPTDQRERSRVFLCHSTGDKAAVRDLYRRLKADGQRPWQDEQDIIGGQDWDYEIRRAIRASRAVLVCLSSNSISKRGYVQREIRFALDAADEQPEGAIFLVPLRLEPCEIPDRLGRWQAIDLYTENGYSNLLRSLRNS